MSVTDASISIAPHTQTRTTRREEGEEPGRVLPKNLLPTKFNTLSKIGPKFPLKAKAQRAKAN